MLQEPGRHLIQHWEGESVGEDHVQGDLVLDDGPDRVTATGDHVNIVIIALHIICKLHTHLNIYLLQFMVVAQIQADILFYNKFISVGKK